MGAFFIVLKQIICMEKQIVFRQIVFRQIVFQGKSFFRKQKHLFYIQTKVLIEQIFETNKCSKISKIEQMFEKNTQTNRCSNKQMFEKNTPNTKHRSYGELWGAAGWLFGWGWESKTIFLALYRRKISK